MISFFSRELNFLVHKHDTRLTSEAGIHILIAQNHLSRWKFVFEAQNRLLWNKFVFWDTKSPLMAQDHLQDINLSSTAKHHILRRNSSFGIQICLSRYKVVLPYINLPSTVWNRLVQHVSSSNWQIDLPRDRFILILMVISHYIFILMIQYRRIVNILFTVISCYVFISDPISMEHCYMILESFNHVLNFACQYSRHKIIFWDINLLSHNTNSVLVAHKSSFKT